MLFRVIAGTDAGMVYDVSSPRKQLRQPYPLATGGSNVHLAEPKIDWGRETTS
jgi:hypothetical protein